MRTDTHTTKKSARPVDSKPATGADYYVSTPNEYTDKEGEVKTSWCTIGVAFKTTSGGIMVNLNALPLNGKIFLGIPQDK